MLEFGKEIMMLVVRILFINTSLSKLVDRFTELSIRLGTSRSKLGGVHTSKMHHYFIS